MKLIDAFIPAFDYLQKLAPDLVDDSNRTLEQVTDDIMTLLDRERSKVSNKGYSLNQYDTAFFAVCALIDEKILESDWKHRDEWAKAPMQKQYFDTGIAGTQFFEKLDQLNESNKHEQDIREVYLYCLRQGFCGCYFDIGEQSRLQDIIQSNYQLLINECNTQLYDVDIPDAKKMTLGQYSAVRLKELTVVWGPISIVIIIFLYLRYDLLNVISTLMNGI